MSILQTANVHFDATGLMRMGKDGSDVVKKTNGSSMTVDNTITATDFNSVSDISLKENIKSIDNSIYILSKINPVLFNWKENGKKSYGMIVQEIEKVLPELVLQQENGYKSVAYIQLIALLIDAVNNLNKEVETLKSNKS